MSFDPSWHERVLDILDAIHEIRSFTAHLDFAQFQADLKTVRAVEMNLIIIGEATASIPEDVQAAHPDMPWHLMRGMRNRIVHAYFAVDERILWDTIRDDLPSLERRLRLLIDRDV
jgi:uncharacterized protein with HEPN domain